MVPSSRAPRPFCGSSSFLANFATSGNAKCISASVGQPGSEVELVDTAVVGVAVVNNVTEVGLLRVSGGNMDTSVIGVAVGVSCGACVVFMTVAPSGKHLCPRHVP